jgi:hypothetical protein
MNKILQTILVDNDIFDELCSYPDHRVEFIGESVAINEDVEDQKFKGMAIEALGQDPCDYCISRSEALKCISGDFYEDGDVVASRCYSRIAHLPPVTPYKKREKEFGEEE